jgi:hypothetical protein
MEMNVMRLGRILSSTVLLSIGLALPVLVIAKQSGACEFMEKVALKKALKTVGGNIAADIGGEAWKATGRAIAGGTVVGMDAVVEYFTHPDDTRLDAAMHKLLEGGTKIVFPTYGITVVAGRFLLGSPEKPGFASTTVEHVVEAARSGQLDAFICGDRSYDNLFAETSFFDLNAVRNRGITCENFTDRVRSTRDLEQMRSLWFGYYKRTLLDVNPGTENRARTQEMLDQGWARLEQSWKLQWAEKLYAEMREALKREARELAQQPSATRCLAAAATATTPGVVARSVNFAGVYSNGTSAVTISGSGTSLTAQEKWATGGRNGSNTWTNCRVSGNSAKCDWTGTYLGDPDKTADRRGTLTATLNGNTLTGSYTEAEPTFHWKVRPYPSAMHKGAVWPFTLMRT